jgi:hypothetical protein
MYERPRTTRIKLVGPGLSRMIVLVKTGNIVIHISENRSAIIKVCCTQQQLLTVEKKSRELNLDNL